MKPPAQRLPNSVRTTRRKLAVIVLSFAVATVLMATAAWFFFARTPLAVADVYWGPALACRPMQPAAAPATSWRGPVLQLQVDVTVNCAAGGTSFAVQRVGSTLLVRGVTPTPETSAGCWCARTYLLSIPGLPRSEDYQIVQYAWP
jgi:hypothetical protein